MYKAMINLLVNLYSGTISWKLGKFYMSAVKPTFLVFFLIWGALKVYQAVQTKAETGSFATSWAWWDYIMALLLILQMLAAFTSFAAKEQQRLNKG